MRLLLAIIVGLLALHPAQAFAQTDLFDDLPGGTITDTVFDTPDLGPMKDPKQIGYGFCVLGFACELNPTEAAGLSFFYRIVNYVASFIGLVLVLILLYGAARTLTSFGDPEGWKKGKSAIIAALIGFIILVVAYAVVVAFLGITK